MASGYMMMFTRLLFLGCDRLISVLQTGIEQKIIKNVNFDILSAFMWYPITVLANPRLCQNVELDWWDKYRFDQKMLPMQHPLWVKQPDTTRRFPTGIGGNLASSRPGKQCIRL